MYYEYWNLNKPPFDNVPDPSMYVDSHSSVENAIAETIFAIEEGNDCISVIVGDVGLGKTLSLRIIIDSLDQDKYRIAFVTNPDMSFVQLLKEIIGQLIGAQCEAKRKVDLLETFNRLLFEVLDEGKRVLIVIDEANAMSPANLESLRLLTNMQDDHRNLFTIVLAGQIELARRLEHPKRANLFQRIGTYSRIDKMDSEELVRDYIEVRLRLAGGDGRGIFTDGAVSLIWSYSESGVPRLVNKLCKLSLKAGETNGFNEITPDVVKQIGDRFQRLTGPSVQKRKPRVRPADLGTAGSSRHLRVSEMVPETDVPVVAKNDIESVTADPAMADQTMAPGPQLPVLSAAKGLVEAYVNGAAVAIEVPQQILSEARACNDTYRAKLAGVLAAQAIEKCPQLTASPDVDPVMVWHELRDAILGSFDRQQQAV